MTGGRRLASGSAVCAALVLGGAAVHVQQVHSRACEYRWSPSAAAPKVQYASRDHLRRRRVPSAPADAVPLGRTEGGGLVHGRTLEAAVPVVVYVTDRADTFEYSLSGGP